MNLFKKILLRTIYALTALAMVIYLAVWGFSPMIARAVLADPLLEQGVVLDEKSHVRYNPFRSEVSIRDFSWQRNGETVFAIKAATVEVHLHQLLQNKILIDTFDISGVTLFVSNVENIVEVAGIRPPAAEPEVEESASEGQSSPFPYTILADKLVLSDITIDFVDGVGVHEANIKQLEFANLNWTPEKQSLSLSIAGGVNQSDLSLQVEFSLLQNEIDIATKLDWKNIQLDDAIEYLPPGMEVYGRVDLAVNPLVRIKDTAVELSVPELALTLRDLKATAAGFDTRLAEQSVLIKDLNLTDINGRTAINGQMQLASRNLNVESGLGEQWLSLDSLEIDSLVFDIPELMQSEAWKLSLPLLELKGLQGSKVSEALPALAALESLQLQNLSFQDYSVALEAVVVDALRAHVELNNEKQLVTLIQLPESNSEEPVPAVEDSRYSETALPLEEEQPQLQFAISRMAITGASAVTFIDRSVNPSYERTFLLDELSLGKIDSRAINEASDFIFRGRSDQYGTINLAGFIKPLTPELNFSIAGDLKEFDLPAVSTYVQSLGVELNTGQLDLGLEVAVTDGELDGEAKLLLRGVDIEKADAVADANLVGQGAMPLNVALGMLKDGDGNIKLDIPLSGSVNDPNFGVGSFVTLVTKKAILTATKSYVLDAFVPYAKVLSVAMSAGDLVMRARFEDLLYAPAQAALMPEQQEYIDELIALLQKKDSMTIKVCGIAATSEATALTLEPQQLPTDVLRALAQQRGQLLKEKLVAEGGIASARILLCNPALDEKEEAQGRVEISL